MWQKIGHFLCSIGLHNWRFFDVDVMMMRQDLGHMKSFWYCERCNKTTDA